jgi:hypothetical protein
VVLGLNIAFSAVIFLLPRALALPTTDDMMEVFPAKMSTFFAAKLHLHRSILLLTWIATNSTQVLVGVSTGHRGKLVQW